MNLVLALAKVRVEIKVDSHMRFNHEIDCRKIFPQWMSVVDQDDEMGCQG